MGTDLNSNIVGAKRASELTKVTGNLNGIYSKTQSKQKDALSQLFSQKYFNSTTEKAVIDRQIKDLEAKIKEFDKKIAELEKQIEGKQDQLDKARTDIADEVAKIVSDTENYEATSKRMMDNAIEEAERDYKGSTHSKANGGELSFKDFLLQQMGIVNGQISGGKGKIDAAIDALSAPQSKLSGLVDQMEGFIDEVGGLNSQYGTTKSTLELLKLTRDNMASAAGSYQTKDTDPSVPIFTPAKEDLADGFLAKYTSRMSGRENQTPVVSTADKAAVTDKYANMAKAQTKGVDAYSANNAQLKSFSDALNSGMLNEMQGAGFTKKEMLDTIKQIFPSIGISHGDDGRAVVPYGHGAEAKDIYTKFTAGFGKIEGAGQRDDLQVAEMDKAIKNDKIIADMKNNDFTWKECAYTLTRLWPGGGIGFNLGEKEITLPIGDDKSKGTFDAMEKQIKENYPDVKINRGTPDETVSKEPPKRTDPVGFHVGDNSYEFVIDRNKDGVINDFSEMMGADGTCGMEELAMFDADGDGHINGDELKNVLVLNTEHKNRDYEFLTAEQLGIKDIDLDSFKEKEQARADGKDGEDFININNSLITGTFDITMKNGKEAEGYQKYVTEDYMKAVYDPILGENIYSQLDGKKVDSVIDKSFDEAGDKLEDLNDFADALDAAKGYDNIKSALRTKLNNSANEAMGYKAQQMAFALNESAVDFNKEKLEMSVSEADRIIERYLDKAEKNKEDEDK